MNTIGKQRKNHRHHAGIKGVRPDNALLRRQEAVERQTAYNSLTIEQKIDKLDMKLGKGVGAVKQRARLAALLQERNKPVEVPQAAPPQPEYNKKSNKKSN